MDRSIAIISVDYHIVHFLQPILEQVHYVQPPCPSIEIPCVICAIITLHIHQKGGRRSDLHPDPS